MFAGLDLAIKLHGSPFFFNISFIKNFTICLKLFYLIKMSNKRNTRAGTSCTETSTALPTVPVPKKKRKPVPQELPQEPTQVS